MTRAKMLLERYEMTEWLAHTIWWGYWTAFNLLSAGAVYLVYRSSHSLEDIVVIFAIGFGVVAIATAYNACVTGEYAFASHIFREHKRRAMDGLRGEFLERVGMYPSDKADWVAMRVVQQLVNAELKRLIELREATFRAEEKWLKLEKLDPEFAENVIKGVKAGHPAVEITKEAVTIFVELVRFFGFNASEKAKKAAA